MSRIIEFMGLPGAGKSTLAHVLLKELRKGGFPLLSSEEAVIRCIRRRDDGILKNLMKRLPFAVWEPVAGTRTSLDELHGFASMHADFFGLWFEVLNRGPVPETWRQCILYALFKRCVERQLWDAHLNSDENVLVEEGFMLGVITMLGCLPPGSPCEKDVDRYVRHMPVPFAVFRIETDPNECARRLRQRPEMPLLWAECTEPELIEQLEYGIHCLDMAAIKLARRGVPIFQVSNPEGGALVAQEQIRTEGKLLARKITESR